MKHAIQQIWGRKREDDKNKDLILKNKKQFSEEHLANHNLMNLICSP